MTTVSSQSLVTSPAPPASATTKPNGVLDKDAFLKLLVAQLKYQDPMAPSDPAAMMAQSSQMAMVERLEELQKATADLVSEGRARGAAALLGQTVTWVDPLTGDERSGVVTAARPGGSAPILVVGDEQIPYGDVTGVAVTPVSSSSASA
jgi:flagellar basal-body rod modification protein FlgD